MSNPRGSTAVMARRHEPPDSLDFFPTPPWATRALFVHILPRIGPALPAIRTAWDPACGEGHMAGVLAERFAVRGSDVFDYGRGYLVEDFLDPLSPGAAVDLIATNPPFKVADQFALKALALAPVVALLLRMQWFEGVDRYASIFSPRPPTLFAPFAERVPMTRGRWDPEASSATAYAWFVWVAGLAPLPPFVVPPGCRRGLTLPSDFARFAVQAEAPLLAALDLA